MIYDGEIMKKIICILLAAVLPALIFGGCSGKSPDNPLPGVDITSAVEPSTNEDGSIVAQARLVYEKNDSLNPYKAVSPVNIRLLSLVYDGLFSLDSAYNLNGAVAKGCAGGTNTVNVMLNTSARFSDGTPVTQQDIIYSFELAKDSDTYGERLRHFTDVSAPNPSNMIFTLDEPDIYAQNCLTFPIIKEGSDEARPTGTGRYVFTEDAGRLLLEVNPNRSGFSPSIACFELTEIKDSSVTNSSLEIGSTCFSFDELSDGSYTRVNAKTQNVLMNNLVYLGVNGSNEYLSDPLIRRAVSAAIDRSELVTSAFQGHAKAAVSPFNPDWNAISGTDGSPTIETSDIPSLLEESENNPGRLPFSLVVNAENSFKLDAAKQIKTMLGQAGIAVTIYALPKEDFFTAVRSGDFDMYIGEIKLTDNMNLYPLFRGGRCSYGVTSSMQEQSYSRYVQMLSGECEIMDFINVFASELPFIPLCYRSGLALYTNSIDFGDSACCIYDVFCNVDRWTVVKDE